MRFPRRPAAIFTLIGGMAGAQPVLAQTLVQLHEEAARYDATVQSARAQLDAAQYRADQARAGLLPQIGLSAGVNHLITRTEVAGNGVTRNLNVGTGSVNASQPLFRPANAITWEQAKRQVDAVRLQLDSAEQDLIVRVSQAYFDVLAAQDTLDFVRALKSSVGLQLEAARRNFEVGNATITDSREAEARFDLARAQEIAAENDLQVKRLALDQLVGRTGVAPHPLIKPVQLPPVQPPDLQSWVDSAATQHPAVRQSLLALDVAKLETDKAKTGHLPTVDLQASYAHTRYPDGNPTVSAAPRANYFQRNASVGVALNWPLFAGFAVQNRIRETLSLEDKARADMDAAQRTVSQAARAAYYGVQSGQGQVQALQAAERSSLTALEANRLGYEVGVRINIDVLNAESQLFQTRRDLAQATYNVLVGGLRLKQAAGTLGADDLQPINRLLAPTPVALPAAPGAAPGVVKAPEGNSSTAAPTPAKPATRTRRGPRADRR